MIRFAPLALLAAMTLTGCSSLSSDVSKLDLSLSGSDTLNPDLNGRPPPIVIRLIELKHPVAFQNADFFSLYERPREALSPDLVASEEIELSPGEKRDLKLSVQDGSRYVGVLAAYRDLPETQWRYVIEVPAKQITRADLSLDAEGIHSAAPEKKAKD